MTSDACHIVFRCHAIVFILREREKEGAMERERERTLFKVLDILDVHLASLT